jgi:ATP-dependent Clp protease ATP-binding subunit ClpC
VLAERGYDPVLGARPLRRTIQRELEDSLSEKILYGDLRPGQVVKVAIEGEGDNAIFTFTGEQRVQDDIPDSAEGIREPASSRAGATVAPADRRPA